MFVMNTKNPRDAAALEIAFIAGWKEADEMSPVKLEAELNNALSVYEGSLNPVQKQQAKGFIVRATEIKVELENPSTIEKWKEWLRASKV